MNGPHDFAPYHLCRGTYLFCMNGNLEEYPARMSMALLAGDRVPITSSGGPKMRRIDAYPHSLVCTDKQPYHPDNLIAGPI